MEQVLAEEERGHILYSSPDRLFSYSLYCYKQEMRFSGLMEARWNLLALTCSHLRTDITPLRFGFVF